MEKSPDAFRTISEVASELGLAQHVLRFWESKFPQLRPLKRGGGRRFYRPDDVALLRSIQRLLHDSGYTIRGVQRILKQQGPRAVTAMGTGEMPIPPAVSGDEAEKDLPGEPPFADGFGPDGDRSPSDAPLATPLRDHDSAHLLVATLRDCASLLAEARTTDVPPRLAQYRSDEPRGTDEAPVSPGGLSAHGADPPSL